MPKSMKQGRDSTGSYSTRQRAVVPSSGMKIRRSSRRAPATDQHSDTLSPADCPPNEPPSRSVADLSFEQLMEAVENRVRQEMMAQSVTLYQPPHAHSVPSSNPIPATIAAVDDPLPATTFAVNDPVPATTVRVVIDLLPAISHPTLHPVSPFSPDMVLRSFLGITIVSVESIVFSWCWYGR